MNEDDHQPLDPESEGVANRHQWMLELEQSRAAGTKPSEQPPAKKPDHADKPAKSRKGPPLSSLVQALKKIPLFKDLSPSLMQKVLRLCSLRSYEPEQRLCTGGDRPVDEMFILLAGKLAVTTTDGLRIATVKPVTIVGEMGFITRRVRSATVEAISPSEVLVISKASFDQTLKGDRAMQVVVHRNIIDILCSKLIQDNVRSRDYLLEKARFESVLEEQKQRVGLALDMLMRSGVSRDQAAASLDEMMIENNPRVLLVDDEEPIRRVMKEVLSTYVVSEAGNGQQALEIAQSDLPDLVITDIKMPEMDGVELLSRLRSDHPEMPVIALSGIVDSEEIEQYGFDAFVEKPIKVEQFRELVEETLQSRTGKSGT